jgi:tetratricopeptide (TPR) repeat protein
MSSRSNAILLAVVLAAALLDAQRPEPNTAFNQAVGQFSLALDGVYGDEGARARASLEAMSRSLDAWDALLRQSESAMAADIRTADAALATRMHLALAGLYLGRARTADGLRELAAARQISQERPDIYLFEALAHAQLSGNDAATTAALRRGSTLDPNEPIAAYLLARRLSREGPTDEANQAYQRFIASHARSAASSQQPSSPPFTDLRPFQETPGVEPFFPPAIHTEGFAELQRGNYTRAINAFRESLNQDPLTARDGVESGALARAAAAFRDGALDRAAEHAAVAIELAPDRSEPHRILGMIRLADRQPGAALEALDAAIALNGRDERARLARADALIAVDSLATAGDALRETLQTHPASGRARYRLAVVYQRQGRFADAVREFTAAAAMNPLLGSNSIYQSLGALARSQQQYDAAIAAFSRRVDLIPNDAEAHHELAEMYFRQGRQTEALAEFTAAVMLNPMRTDSLVSIGQVHLREGRFAEAAAVARRAVALDASHKEARYVLATSLIRAGNMAEGKRELDVYQRLQTEATAAQARRLEIEGLRRDASVSVAAGDVAKAVELLRQALERDKDSARSHLDLGIALLRAGKAAEAIEHLTVAADRDDSEDAHASLAEAYTAAGRRADADRERAIVVRLRQEALRRAGATR